MHVHILIDGDTKERQPCQSFYPFAQTLPSSTSLEPSGGRGEARLVVSSLDQKKN